MRRWIRLAAYLYPASWRKRYGAEFNALLDDTNVHWRDVADVIREALIMQLTNWKSYGKVAGGVALASAVVAFGASYLIPNQYQATAVFRMVPAEGAAAGDVLQLIEQLQERVIGRDALRALITEPSLDLYRSERQSVPLETIVDRMRREHLRIRIFDQPANGRLPAAQAFAISFDYSDPYKAQQVVRELTKRLVLESYVPVIPPARFNGSRLEVFDPARLAETPIMPNHAAFLFAGLAAGLLLGLLTVLVLRGPKRSFRVASFAAAGTLLALVVAFLIPDVFISRSVLRIKGAEEDSSVTAQLVELQQQVLSPENLARVIQLPQLDLYKKERASQSVTEVVEQMRTKNLRVQLYEPPSGSHAQAFGISFSYPDRYKAQAVVRELSAEFLFGNSAQQQGGSQALDLLEPANLPETPASPNRRNIALVGAAVGALIGIFVSRRRGPEQHLTPAPATA